ncbi:MAG: hypothetical protein JST93_11335 [Acidobacteria bacterium]|nr:hypothetical protein [Acidobacteriota bacterium]
MIAKTMFVLGVCALSAAAQSNFAPRCNNTTLRGSYAFTAKGFTVAGSPVPAPLQGPFASLGTAVYDGRGGVVLTASATFNGLTQALPPVKGTYTVRPDCTFVSTLENGATFYASIVDGARELLVIQTTPGVIAAGAALLQNAPRRNDDDDFFERGRPNSCRIGLTRGVYGFISEGFAGPPTVPPPAAGALAGVGTVAFDTNGRFRLTAVRSANGIIDPQPLNLTGVYTFTQDCNFNMTFDVVGFHFNGTVAASGDRVSFLETDPGTTFVVQAKKM